MSVSGRIPVKVVLVDGTEAEINLTDNLKAIGTAADAAGTATVIGLLKQVVEKLEEVKLAIIGGEGGELPPA